MALLAQLYSSGRTAERHVIEADATLRSHDQAPVDVLVADLSTTGCLLVCAEPLALDCEITLGITGLGRRKARVVRALDHRYGCEFLAALTDTEVAAALTTPNGTIVHFPIWPLDTASDEDLPCVDKLPGPIRLAVIIGATMAGWSTMIALIFWLR